MPNEPNSQQAGPAIIGAIVSTLVLAAAKYWPRLREWRKKIEREDRIEEKKESAEKAKIDSDERLGILRLYQEHIADLKATVVEMMGRHKEEMAAQAAIFRQQIEGLIAENKALRDRVAGLERRLDDERYGVGTK